MLCCSVIAQKEETDSHTMSQLLKSVWILFCPLFLERCKKTMQGKIALTLALGVLNLISKPVRQQELLSCTFPFGRIRALSVQCHNCNILPMWPRSGCASPCCFMMVCVGSGTLPASRCFGHALHLNFINLLVVYESNKCRKGICHLGQFANGGQCLILFL